MATLNLCSGCNKNFASASAHAAHRTGGFADGTRRCLSSAELKAAGWNMATEPIKRRIENKPVVEQMETWHAPMDENAKAYFAALSAKGKRSEEEDGPEEELVER